MSTSPTTSSTSSTLHVSWPSISNLGVSYAEAVKQRASTVTLAALALQRWWRWVRAVRSGAVDPTLSPFSTGLSERGRELTPTAIYRRVASSVSMFDATPCFVSEKYDGTNVGKGTEASGVLHGRRSLIAPSSASFQKAPLAHVRSIDTVPVRDAILSLLQPREREAVRDVVMFGELMLGHDKFSYRPRGIEPGRWMCFGAKIVLHSNLSRDDDDDDDEINDADGDGGDHEREGRDDGSNRELDPTEATIAAICSQLREHGLAVTPGLTMFMSPKLRELIGDRFDTVRAVTSAASITSLVLDHPEIVAMLRESEAEGVVVTAERGSFSFKWKSSREEESQAATLLQRSIDLASEPAIRASIAISARHFAAMETLRDIAIANASRAAAAVAPRKSATSEKKVDPLVTMAAELEHAFASALTKYDALEVYFAQGAKALGEIVAALSNEVLDDLLANAARSQADGLDQQQQQQRQRRELEQIAALFVKRRVGKAFGQYKKASPDA